MKICCIIVAVLFGLGSAKLEDFVQDFLPCENHEGYVYHFTFSTEDEAAFMKWQVKYLMFGSPTHKSDGWMKTIADEKYELLQRYKVKDCTKAFGRVLISILLGDEPYNVRDIGDFKIIVMEHNRASDIDKGIEAYKDKYERLPI